MTYRYAHKLGLNHCTGLGHRAQILTITSISQQATCGGTLADLESVVEQFHVSGLSFQTGFQNNDSQSIVMFPAISSGIVVIYTF